MFYVNVYELDSLGNKLTKETHKVYDVDNTEKGVCFLIYNDDGWNYVKSERCEPYREVF